MCDGNREQDCDVIHVQSVAGPCLGNQDSHVSLKGARLRRDRDLDDRDDRDRTRERGYYHNGDVD